MEQHDYSRRYFEYFPLPNSDQMRTTPFAPQINPYAPQFNPGYISHDSQKTTEEDKNNKLILWFQKYREWIDSENTKDWVDKDKIIIALNEFIPFLSTLNFSQEAEQYCIWLDVPFPIVRLYTTQWGNTLFFGHWYSTYCPYTAELYEKCLPLYMILEIEYTNVPISTLSPLTLYRGTCIPNEVLDIIRNLKNGPVFLNSFLSALPPIISTTESMYKACTFIKKAKKRKDSKKILWKYSIIPVDEDKQRDFTKKFPDARIIPTVLDVQDHSRYGEESEWLMCNGYVLIDKIRESATDEEAIVIEATVLNITFRNIDNYQSELESTIIKYFYIGNYSTNIVHRNTINQFLSDTKINKTISIIISHWESQYTKFYSFAHLKSISTFARAMIDNHTVYSAMIDSTCRETFQKCIEFYSSFRETCDIPLFAFKRLNRWFKPNMTPIPSVLNNTNVVFDLTKATSSDFNSIAKDLLILYQCVKDETEISELEDFVTLVCNTSELSSLSDYAMSLVNHKFLQIENVFQTSESAFLESEECYFMYHLKVQWQIELSNETKELCLSALKGLIIQRNTGNTPPFVNSSIMETVSPKLPDIISRATPVSKFDEYTNLLAMALDSMGLQFGTLDDFSKVPQDKLDYWLKRIRQLM